MSGRFIEREAELRWLQDSWQRAKEGRPQVCVVRGESGLGKTRLVKEFYRWLAGHPEFDPGRYWPSVDSQQLDVLPLNPVEGFGRTRRIPWLWWAVRWPDPSVGSARDETPFRLAASRTELLRLHGEVLSIGSVARDRFIRVAVEGAAALISPLSFAKSLVDLAKMFAEFREAARREGAPIEARLADDDAARGRELQRLMKGILGSGAHSVPLVLVLDDAHWMDARSVVELANLIREASEGRWPLQIVATVWEREWWLFAEHSPLSSFPALFRLLEREHGTSGVVDLSSVELRSLQALGTLVREALPGLTDAQLAAVSARCDGNPRMARELVLWLCADETLFVDRNLQGSLSHVGEEALNSQVSDLRQLQQKRFQQLDAGLRDLLALATIQGIAFLRELVLDVARGLMGERTGTEDALLESAVAPYAILSPQGPRVREFREHTYFELSQQRLVRIAERDGVGRLLVEEGRSWLRTGRALQLSSLERVLFCRTMLKLTAGSQQDRILRIELASALAQALYEQGDHAEAARIHDQVLDDATVTVRNIVEQLGVDWLLWHVAKSLLIYEDAAGAQLKASEVADALAKWAAEDASDASRLYAAALGMLVRYWVSGEGETPGGSKELGERALELFEAWAATDGTPEASMDVLLARSVIEGDDVARLAVLLDVQSRIERAVAEHGETARRLLKLAEARSAAATEYFASGDLRAAADNQAKAVEAMRAAMRLSPSDESVADRLVDSLTILAKYSAGPTAIEVAEEAIEIYERFVGNHGKTETRLERLADLHATLFRNDRQDIAHLRLALELEEEAEHISGRSVRRLRRKAELMLNLWSRLDGRDAQQAAKSAVAMARELLDRPGDVRPKLELLARALRYESLSSRILGESWASTTAEAIDLYDELAERFGRTSHWMRSASALRVDYAAALRDDKALEVLERTIADLEAGALAEGIDVETRDILATARLRRGMRMLGNARFDEAHRDFEAVLQHRTQAVSAAVSEAERALCRTAIRSDLQEITLAFEHAAGLGAALPYLERAVREKETEVESGPESFVATTSLIFSLCQLADACESLGRTMDAERALTRGTMALRAVASLQPSSTAERVELAELRERLAERHFRAGSLETAESMFRESIRQLEAVKAASSDAGVRLAMVRAMFGLALCRFEANDKDSAKAYAIAAVEYASGARGWRRDKSLSAVASEIAGWIAVNYWPSWLRRLLSLITSAKRLLTGQ